jgi:hypothetical protein
MDSRNNSGNDRERRLDAEIERYQEAGRFRVGTARMDRGISPQDPEPANRPGARPQPKQILKDIGPADGTRRSAGAV